MISLSNRVIGLLNVVTLIVLIPAVGVGLWTARKSKGVACEEGVQAAFLVLGLLVLVVSLCGLVGSCFRLPWAMWLYVFSLVLIIFFLLPFTIFGVVVTSKFDRGETVEGGGMGRTYSEWLRKKVDDPHYWSATARGCLLSSGSCSWAPRGYLAAKHVSPIQLGCCRRPSGCTDGGSKEPSVVREGDCNRWGESTESLCYDCDSCKAAVLEETRVVLHVLSVVDFMVLVFLIIICTVSCYALKNVRRSQNEYGYEENRMTIIRPRWDYYCWRRLCHGRRWLY